MLDTAYLDNCFRIIVFSTDCNTLKTSNDKKSLAFALPKISNSFLCSFVVLFELINRIKIKHKSGFKAHFKALFGKN